MCHAIRRTIRHNICEYGFNVHESARHSVLLNQALNQMETILLFLGGVGFQEILLIGAVVLILFGAKRVPEFMKGLGKGVKEFKQGIKEVQDDIEKEDSKSSE